ncbi:hypothetical protein [Spirillospora sp. NPDC047279]|uniref:hypothetical protein n=1 Tax=Spirillospora sp. NPDC047279 TaxID=3155478 RepID=UPI0033C634A2
MPVTLITGQNEYGLRQMATKLGLSTWQVRLAREHGLLPEPDIAGRRWSAALAAESDGRTERIRAAFGDEPPVGGLKAALRLAVRVALDVERADIEILVARGDLTVIGRFQEHPIYLLRDLDALHPQTVADVVNARKGPLADTVDARGAATILDWPLALFNRVAAERDLPSDQLGRYALADVRAIAADESLAERGREEQQRLALERARKAESRSEDILRGWLLRCTAYLDRALDDPPDSAAPGRALRSLEAARDLIARPA